MHFQPFAVGLEPLPDVSVFVVGSVVLNQDCSLVVVSASQLFEEAKIGAGIEDRVLTIVEACTPEFDGPKNLYALALPGYRHFRWATHATPGCVQRRILPKAGLVGED